ncbi:hypothetical protein [Haladaptatus sp. NG-WS-4]
MSTIPSGIDADRGPPMALPLGHFLVGLLFLVVAGATGAASALGVAPGLSNLVFLHTLLVGWVCLTILGAMTQFVPVWSGRPLYSRRLASLQLWLVAGGLVGFASALATVRLDLLPAFGTVMLVGFWVFVYNVGRTLFAVESLDVTERHFALAVGYFAIAPAFGVLLAVDFTNPVVADLGLARQNVVASHVTLAVFGGVLTTVLGALYQLSTMFTQTERHGIDVHLARIEEVSYPLGVVALAGGRLLGLPSLARVGAVLTVLGLLSFAVVLVRRLVETQVPRTPMLSRYAVVAVSLALWGVATLPAWLHDPLSRSTVLGTSSTVTVLLFGVVGFVVLGTLYHVVPFIVWMERYSDRLGFERVPMIDDLYDARIARVDGIATFGGGVTVALTNLGDLPAMVETVGWTLLLVGFVSFAANVWLVVSRHGSLPVRRLLLGSPSDAVDVDS